MNARIELSLSRREFLKAAGALVVSAAAPALVTEALAQGLTPAPGKPPLVPGELDSWIAILPDGSVQAFFGKMDMGQTLDVAIAQVIPRVSMAPTSSWTPGSGRGEQLSRS